MVEKNEGMRDRLLARLPQPENLAEYRKETGALLAEHQKALFWEKAPSVMFYLLAVGLFLGVNISPWNSMLGTREVQFLYADACIFFFTGAISDLRYRIYRNRVELLKDVKQVQLQILELQASLTTGHEKQP